MVTVSALAATVCASSYDSAFLGLRGSLDGGQIGSDTTGHYYPASIQSKHRVSHYDVPSSGHVSPTTVDVPANVLPVNFIFRSASSLINVGAKHEGAKGTYKETYSQDEPHQLVHTVSKPIIQEVREIISPYRKITQTVEPVREEIKTHVARGVGHFTGFDNSIGSGGGGVGVGGAGGTIAQAGLLDSYGGIAGGSLGDLDLGKRKSFY